MITAAVTFLSVFCFADENNPDADYRLWYGFEATNSWNTSDWQDNALTSPVISNDFVSEGKKSLQVTLNGKNGTTGMIQVFDPGDMSGADRIKLDVYNSSGRDLQAFIMLKTGAGWTYNESNKVSIKQGWNKGIQFNLKSAEFNNNSGKILFPEFVRRFGIGFTVPKNAEGYVYLDNVLLAGPNIDKLVAAEPVQDKNETGTEVNIDDFAMDRIKWRAAASWSCATDAAGTTETSTTGNWAMRLNYNQKQAEQNAVLMLEDVGDLSDVSAVKVDVYNPVDTPADLSMSLGTGDKWAWQEYVPATIKKGWNRDVTFYFNDKRWKNEGSNWASNTNPDNTGNVKRLSFMLTPKTTGKGYALFDNVRMITTKPSKLDALKPMNTDDYAFYVWNTFEKGVNWTAASEGSGATAIYPSTSFGGENRSGMQVVFSTQTNVDGAAFVYSSKVDFSQNTGMKFDVFNPGKSTVRITIAFITGDQYLWIESKQIDIVPGWNKNIFFDFTKPIFKSAASNWNFTDYLKDREDIRYLTFTVFPGQKMDGSLYVTDFMLARHNFAGDPGRSAGLMFSNNSCAKIQAVQYSLWDEGKSEGSFETAEALIAWIPHIESSWGACNLSLSDKYASQGGHSMKLTYKDTGVKFGMEYDRTMDITKYESICFDVYNPGSPLKFTMAFVTSDFAWHEMSSQVEIKPGWNKNITVRFDTQSWSKAVGNLSPVPFDGKSSIIKMMMIFQNGKEGVVYVDNLRWGAKAGMQVTSGLIEQDISLLITPFNALEARLTFRGAYYYGQNADLSLLSGHIILRGLGNELTLFSGEYASTVDDIYGIISSNAVGTNLTGVNLAGMVYPINTSYTLSCISLNPSQPWKIGSSLLSTARIKKYFLDKNYIGALFMNYRRGYQENANIFTDTVEESANIYGGDTSLFIPVFDLFNINLKMEVLATAYSTLSPVYLLSGPPIQYVYKSVGDGSRNMLYYTEASIHKGTLTFNAVYRQIDPFFGGVYGNPDAGMGLTYVDLKLTNLMDDLPPFSMIKTWSEGWAAFVNNTKLMVEYDTNWSTKANDNYARKTLTLDLKNDDTKSFYNYHLWWKNNFEGGSPKYNSNKITGITKFLFNNMLTINLLGRIENLYGPVSDGGGYVMKYNWKYTGYIQASLKPVRDFILSGSYKAISSGYGNQGNWYVNAEMNLFESIAVTLGYGDAPFTGYWMDDNSNDTLNIFTFSMKGRY